MNNQRAMTPSMPHFCHASERNVICRKKRWNTDETSTNQESVANTKSSESKKIRALREICVSTASGKEVTFSASF
jgi:hypothetical protein